MPTPIITETPRNPRNPGAFTLESVPPSGTTKSRFALETNFEGNRLVGGPAACIAAAFRELARARAEQTPLAAPDPKTVRLFFVAKTEKGEWTTVPRGSVSAVPTLTVQRSGRFKRQAKQAGALLDEAFLGLADAREEQLWDALLALCEEEKPDSQTTRQLNDAVAELVLCTAGLTPPDVLPPIGAPHK